MKTEEEGKAEMVEDTILAAAAKAPIDTRVVAVAAHLHRHRRREDTANEKRHTALLESKYFLSLFYLIGYYCVSTKRLICTYT